MPAPVVLFCYNRLECLKQTVAALASNPEVCQTDLILFSDGPENRDDTRKVSEVREYIRTISGFRNMEIHEAEKNMGLAESVIHGVTDVVNRYGRIIVLEDDIVAAPCFLSWMNRALDLYETEEKVAGIHAWTPAPEFGPRPDSYFIREVGCWGWATWKRGWDLFEKDGKKLLDQFSCRKMICDFDVYDSYPYYGMLQDQVAGKVDSWAIRWYASVFLKGKLGLQPGKSLVKNIGGQTGTHFSSAPSQTIANDFITAPPVLRKAEPVCNEKIIKKIHRKFNQKLMHRDFLFYCKKRIKAFLSK